MKESLVEHLVCPTCNKNFILKTKKKVRSEIIQGELICQKLHKFPINQGIPRLHFKGAPSHTK